MDIRPIDANALLAKPGNERKVTEYDEVGYAMTYHAVPKVKIVTAPTISLNTLRDAIYEDAVAHGLWMKTDGPLRCACRINDEVQELSEAAGNVLDVRIVGGDETEAWTAYCEELADVIITGFSVAGRLDIDIDAAIRRKMEINKGRPWKRENE